MNESYSKTEGSADPGFITFFPKEEDEHPSSPTDDFTNSAQGRIKQKLP